jgi:DNA-binding transcriptional ArsR family regulator
MNTPPFEQLASLDRWNHEPNRLAILSALLACRGADFLFLQRITGLTEGNLSSHLAELQQAGLVEIEKSFIAKKPYTMVRLSGTGREALEGYWKEVTELREASARWRPETAKPVPA